MKKPTLLLFLLTSVHLTSCSNIEVQPDNEKIGDDCRSTDSLYAISRDELYSSLSLQSLTLDLPGQQKADKESPSLWHRIRKGYALKVEDNERIQEAIAKFTRSSAYFEMISMQATPYLYHIVEEVERRGLPLELAFLPAIESAYKPTARSNKSAVGLWQFIPSTGRIYGLEQNAWYDGRRDIVASTSAALDYLEKLYVDFNGDWLKAIGAYNCGEGCMQRAVTRNEERGEPTDFWSLDLPKETEEYVPNLLAVSKVIAQPEVYGVQLAEVPNKAYLKQIDVGRQIDLSLAAELAGISPEEFKLLNAGHRRQTTAPQGPHCVTLPVEKVAEFKQRLADMTGLDDASTYSEALPPRSPLVVADRSRIFSKPQTVVAMNATTEVVPSTIVEKRSLSQSVANVTLASPEVAKPASQSVERMALASRAVAEPSAENVTLASQEVVKPALVAQKPEIEAVVVVPEKATVTVAASPKQNEVPLPKKAVKKSSPKIAQLALVQQRMKEKARVEKKAAELAAARAAKKAEKLAKVQKSQVADKSDLGKTQTHQVKPGDTLAKLANRYNTTVVKLRKLNKLESHSLQRGQKLQVPLSFLSPNKTGNKVAVASKVVTSASAKIKVAEKSHQVQVGETLWRIAKRYDVSVSELRKLNKLAQPIRVGQKLVVPTEDQETL